MNAEDNSAGERAEKGTGKVTGKGRGSAGRRVRAGLGNAGQGRAGHNAAHSCPPPGTRFQYQLREREKRRGEGGGAGAGDRAVPQVPAPSNPLS